MDKHLLTRTPGAVDAVRQERDIMDVLGGLATAAAAAAAEGGGGEEEVDAPSISSTSAASAALARLPPGLHPLWAATRTVRLLFTFQDAASLYFGLEVCPGGDLFSQVAARGRLSATDALPYLADAVAALAALTSVGVTHRDVKPENFMLDGGGRLKLGDFGCAAWVDGDQRQGGSDGSAPPPPPTTTIPSSPANHPLAQGTRTPSVVGTADYVPPEALGGLNSSSSSSDGGGGGGEEAEGEEVPGAPPSPQPPPPFAADAWALGCVAYQLLVGVPPFRAATEYLTYQRIAAHDLRWPGRRGSSGEEEEEEEGTGGEPGAAARADAADADTLPADAVHLITRLLDPNPATRLGAGGHGGGGGGGMEAVMRHPFFSSIDWTAPGGGLPAPSPVPPPPPGDDPGEDAVSAEEDEVDWELASLAASLPVHYSYEAGQIAPPGATGVVPPPSPRAASPAVAREDWGEG